MTIDKHHVGSVMPSFSSVDWTEDGLGNPLKMHAHKELITDVLKGEMGFDGLVISDWRAIHQIPGDFATQVTTSVNAGVDMFMEPKTTEAVGYQEFIAALIAAVEAGDVPMTRIDDAVTRILTVKFELGLFEKPMTDRRHIDSIGSKKHRAVARDAVAQSQVLLKNRRDTLPLKAGGQQVYVAGSNADNIGNQAGGWTLTWQGGSTNVIPGDTILDAIRDSREGEGDLQRDGREEGPSRSRWRGGGGRDAAIRAHAHTLGWCDTLRSRRDPACPTPSRVSRARTSPTWPTSRASR